MAVGRRVGQRFDADHEITTEATIFLGRLDPEALGESLRYATHYEPTPLHEFEALMEMTTIPAADSRCPRLDLTDPSEQN